MSKPSEQPALTLLHESIVHESEIDSLGHMNVRFYVERAARANAELLQRLGIASAPGQQLRRFDTHNRFHREQFAGARLHTLGGMVATESREGVTGYYEIRNADTGDIAATYIMTSCVIDSVTEEKLELTLPDTSAARSLTIDIPEYGRPKSLSLSPIRLPAFDEITPLIPESDLLSGMTGRREGIVMSEDCDAGGYLAEDKDLVHMLFRPQPGEEMTAMGPPHLRDEQGRLYSWAMMEIRSLIYQRPREGETIVSLSADVNYGEKWRHSRRWIYSRETRALLGISDQTGICMDLEARRAIPIPDEARAAIEAHCLRDYA